MNKVSPGFIFGIVASLVIGFGIVAGVVFALRANTGLGYESDVLYAKQTGPGTAELDLSAFPDSQACHPDAPNPEITWVTYCQTSLEAPPNTLVTVIVKQYDSSTGVLNGFFRNVQGTVGGTATYNGKTLSQLKDADIAHTFTLQSQPFTPAANRLYVSVPLLGVPNNSPSNTTVNGVQYPTPAITEFQFRTGPAGVVYVWHCYVPCGNGREAPYGFSGPMSTTGFMAGTLTVANY